ncbi:MAG TPA: hypothetical protein V6C58_18140 [Allocoleopsis sp.]
MGNIIQGDGFTIDETKFDFFFGRVTSNPVNKIRSLQNLKELNKLGINDTIEGKQLLMQIFQSGLNGQKINEITKPHGLTVVRKIEISNNEIQGTIEISYFYLHSDLTLTPKITTIIPKIYQ